MPYAIADQLIFPHPSLADADGLLGIGGDLSPQRLILAYQHGIFPWFSEGDPILWYAPQERFVLKPEALKISKSMRQFMRKSNWTVHRNKNFEQVIKCCAAFERKDQDGTWITNAMQDAYLRLHRLGIAHSYETYNKQGELIGGLYGVKVGKVFCGESMFAKASNASKLAFITLAQEADISLIDCQVYTEHLASLGAAFIPGAQYYALLQQQDISDVL